MTTGFRIERDSMGEVHVPAGALYGPQTQRAVENFPISRLRFPRSFLKDDRLAFSYLLLGDVYRGWGNCAESRANCEYNIPCRIEATTAAETPLPETSATISDSPPSV